MGEVDAVLMLALYRSLAVATAAAAAAEVAAAAAATTTGEFRWDFFLLFFFFCFCVVFFPSRKFARLSFPGRIITVYIYVLLADGWYSVFATADCGAAHTGDCEVAVLGISVGRILRSKNVRLAVQRNGNTMLPTQADQGATYYINVLPGVRRGRPVIRLMEDHLLPASI